MTQKVPALISPMVKVVGQDNRSIGVGFIIPPWNSFFQQFVQEAPTAIDIDVTASPFVYAANVNGKIVISGGTLTSVVLTRGLVSMDTGNSRIIPVRIGDSVTVTYSVLPAMRFLGD